MLQEVAVKKVLPAFERNSIGPLNHKLFSIPTTSTQYDTPITAIVNTVEEVSSTILHNRLLTLIYLKNEDE
ncbi:hypothetical protein BpHYR1_015850, partial [Brachionus plicatilis]